LALAEVTILMTKTQLNST